ncbi:MAG: hypothetical protein ACRDMJ_06360 [Solirubrobacteraceae bacterium]
MSGFRPREQLRPPPPRRVTDVAIERFEHVLEVEPELMREHVRQQPTPNWDTLRIVAARHDHLAWMHRHWAGTVLSAAELLDEITAAAPDGNG